MLGSVATGPLLRLKPDEVLRRVAEEAAIGCGRPAKCAVLGDRRTGKERRPSQSSKASDADRPRTALGDVRRRH